jgi:DNA-binding MarR family transcriptional regulator
MTETGERELELALAKAGILQLTKCTQIVKRRTETALKRRARITLREVWVLVAAGCEKPVTQKQIAKHLALNQNVIVLLIDKLEKSGHVRRVRNQHNRREQFVRVTAKGRTTLRRLLAEQAKYYRIIFAPVDDAVIATIFEAARAFLAFEAAKSSKPRST